MDPEKAFKHCLRCGAETSVSGRKMDCAACGYTFFLNPSTAVGGLILNPNREVLLTKRGRDPHKGSWDIPGGFVEMEETAEEALARELEEELGLKLDSGKFEYFNSSYDRYLFEGVNDHVLTIAYIVNLDKDKTEFRVDDDITYAKFFSKNEFDPKDIQFSSMRNLVLNFFASEG